MAVTMAQIDQERERVDEVLFAYRRQVERERDGYMHSELRIHLKNTLAIRRAKVEELLREWWAQGCQEAM